MRNNAYLSSLAEEASRKLDQAYIRMEEAQDLLERIVAELPDRQYRDPTVETTKQVPGTPGVDRSTFSVSWRRARCVLGPTFSFTFLEVIARRPNRFLTYDQLIEAVWDGQIRSDATVRTVARDLRRQLVAAGMHDLAAAVQGRMKTYGLILDTSYL